MVIYPVPIEVTQARVQLVADQTAKAPARTISDDVLEVAAAKNQAVREGCHRPQGLGVTLQIYDARSASKRVADSRRLPANSEPASHQMKIRMGVRNRRIRR
jgi:hypothetical protein